MKKVILTLAVIAGTLSLAIAGTPKGETKSDAPTVSTTQAMYYWFPADAAGSLTSRVAKSTSATELDHQCQGSGDICGIAYVASDTQINGSGQRVLKSGVTESSSQAESHEQ